LYDWLLLDPGADEHLLLVRRSISKPTELAYYICHTHHPVPVAELVRVAGSRRGVEETFQFAKNETGLDHYQVRRYDAWYRHMPTRARARLADTGLQVGLADIQPRTPLHHRVHPCLLGLPDPPLCCVVREAQGRQKTLGRVLEATILGA
jgi:hypothetical protein